ncbi:hypothetical protein ACP4OV_029588 [Aristida adscensionis]
MDAAGGSGGAEGGASGVRFPILQANRDPVSNWEVDIAKNLEEYLLKICSGEVSAEDGAHSVNFAEAGAFAPGISSSVQPEGRVLVLIGASCIGVPFANEESWQDQQENGSAQGNENDPGAIRNDEDDIFLGLDEVPVEARTTLDNNINRDDLQRKNVRPPANLLVFEGDCLDSEASELDSYWLATCDFYEDFLLLDPRDAPAVLEFLQGNKSGKDNVAHRGSSERSRSPRNVFASPNGRSGGTGRRLDPGKVQGDQDQTQPDNPEQSQKMNATPICDFNVNDNHWSDHHVDNDFPDADMSHLDDADTEYPSDDENPWKPLNPHEPGNLKIKPYRRVKDFAKQVIGAPKKKTLASLFPMANMELTKTFEVHQSQQEELGASQSPLPYEKLRRSFESGEQDSCHVFDDFKDDIGPDIAFDDPGETSEPDVPMYDMDVEIGTISSPDKNNDATLGGTGTQDTQDDLGAEGSLADLCHLHLNALLASIAEVEQQTELDARVSTWKERIEQALEEQDRNPPFDIGLYGEQIIETLSSRTDNTGVASFSEIVSGRPKYEVARTFSALLQLVNGRSVDLDKGQATNELVCYTAENPFHVKLIGPNRRPEMGFAGKRVKSPLQNCGKGGESSSLSQQKSPKKQSHQNGKTSIRLTPDGKRRRRSAQLLQPFNLESSG